MKGGLVVWKRSKGERGLSLKAPMEVHFRPVWRLLARWRGYPGRASLPFRMRDCCGQDLVMAWRISTCGSRCAPLKN